MIKSNPHEYVVSTFDDRPNTNVISKTLITVKWHGIMITTHKDNKLPTFL